jgi:hypothetical protein
MGIPAVEVAEIDGRIWIQLYGDIFDIESEETRTRIARIGEHLRRLCR